MAQTQRESQPSEPAKRLRVQVPVRVEPTDVQTPRQRARLETDLNYPKMPGRHSVRSPVAGSRASELQALLASARTRPEISSFATALYQPENVYLLRPYQEAGAEKISLRIFKSYLARYPLSGLNEKNAVDWGSQNLTRTYINEAETQTSTWNVQPIVFSGRDVENGRLLPRYLRAYHELMHVEETPIRAQPDWNKSNPELSELMPTIATLVIADQINKELRGIPLSREVNYARFVEWDGHRVPVGRIANYYRTLYNQYGGWGAALNSPESLEFMRTGIIPETTLFTKTGL